MSEPLRAEQPPPLEIDATALLRATIESTADGMLVVDRNRHIVSYNHTFLRIWGFPDDLFGGVSDPELISRAKGMMKDPEEFVRKIEELYRAENSDSFELIELLDGRKFERYSQPLKVGGESLGRVWSFRDVTERFEAEARRKLMEEELRASRHHLEQLVLERTSFLSSILENIPDMIFVKDAKDLKFVLFNKAGEALLGYSRADLLGKSDYDFFPKDEADFFTRKDREVLASNQVLDIPEEPIHTRNMGVRSLHTKKIPIRDPEGNARYLLGISEDITVHKQMAVEKRARVEAESESKKFEYLAEISRILSISLDPEARLASLAKQLVPRLADWCLLLVESDNRRFSAAAHFDPGLKETVEGLKKFTPDEDASEGISRVKRSRKAVVYSDINDQLLLSAGLASPFGTREESDLARIRKLGARSFLAVPIVARDKIQGVMVLVSARDPRRYGSAEIEMANDIAGRAGLAVDNALLFDVTRSAVKVREDFISIASHELRTPLTPLSAQLQLIERMVARGDAKISQSSELLKLIRMSRRDLSRLSQLVENLLDISRNEAGRLALQREWVNVTELVRAVVERLGPECERVHCIIIPDFRVSVMALIDTLRIEQVVGNLIGNAIKFGGGRPIDVSVAPLPGEAVEIRVSDRGVGISKQDLERIFERFERAVSERQFGGLGLGLYVARQIVQAHGGRITVESKPGRGSTFIVTLPVGKPGK